MSVMTSSDIKAGQEIFTHYGYEFFKGAPHPMPSDFPWYWDLKMKTEKSDRLEARKYNKERLEEIKRTEEEKLRNKKSTKQKLKTTKIT